MPGPAAGSRREAVRDWASVPPLISLSCPTLSVCSYQVIRRPANGSPRWASRFTLIAGSLGGGISGEATARGTARDEAQAGQGTPAESPLGPGKAAPRALRRPSSVTPVGGASRSACRRPARHCARPAPRPPVGHAARADRLPWQRLPWPDRVDTAVEARPDRRLGRGHGTGDHG